MVENALVNVATCAEMTRDSFAIRPTDANVEHGFGKNGRVARWTRSRSNQVPYVLYEGYLTRITRPLTSSKNIVRAYDHEQEQVNVENEGGGENVIEDSDEDTVHMLESESE
jgi:hypothetical protein